MIYKLPTDVYQRIKAGEVIEDPASVVRELLDNSLDAKATQIVVELESGGLDRIFVKDNGEGMTPQDLQICFLEHTTSKIRSFEDISTLQTHGFRGEALASICRVSRVNIVSATDSQKMSEKIWVEDGHIQQQAKIAHRTGTMIEIRDLFHNLPVRKSFLRSKTREVSKVKREVMQKALAFPHVTFQLLSDKKTVLLCMAQSPKDRLLALTRIKDPVHKVQFQKDNLEVEGYITGIDQTFDSASELFVFLNRRPFQSKRFYGVMKQSLSQLIPRHKYLGGYLYITTSPKNIDPNVHPAKKEIKMFNEDTLASGLYNTLRGLFYRSSYQTFLDLRQAPQDPSPTSPEILNFTTIEDKSIAPSEPLGKQTFFSFPKGQLDIPSVTISKEFKSSSYPVNYKYIGVYQGTYWIVEKDQNIILVDFHAAHERMRYENLKVQLKERTIEIQPLLTPDIISLSEKAWGALEKSESHWKEMGFEFELLGDFKVLFRAVPYFLEKDSVQTFVTFLEEFEDSSVADISDIQDRWLKFAACRKSYMANDHVPESEIRTLLDNIFAGKFPLTCPHGRPFTLTLPYQTIIGHFLR